MQFSFWKYFSPFHNLIFSSNSTMNPNFIHWYMFWNWFRGKAQSTCIPYYITNDFSIGTFGNPGLL